MNEISPETRKILLTIPDDEWRRYYRELVIYAYARCRRWVWRTGGRENLPEGYSPETITQEAIARLYDGTRVWDHDQHPGGNPVPFLKTVIDSLVWALLTGAEHKRTVPLEQGHASGEGDQEPHSQDVEAGAGLYDSSAPSPETQMYLEEMGLRIRAAIADREDLLQLYEHLLQGLKSSEIAEQMNTDVSRIYVLRKTFDRRTAEIQHELFGMKRTKEVNKEGR
jgi:DNA-directed RNA polymerase specialized sigma24 family protein